MIQNGIARLESGSQEAILTELFNKIVVFLVCADPEPDDEIAVFLRNSAIVISDSYGPDISDKRFELR